MDNLKSLHVFELKSYKELFENRLDELRRHQVDGAYYPVFTEKEKQELKALEEKTQLALTQINKLLREKLDNFIANLAL